MTRVRIESTKLNTWEEVDLNLKEIAECQLAVEAIEGKMNETISDLKLDAAVKAKPHLDKIKKLEFEVKGFTEENKAEFNGKTRFMDFGKVGFRKSSKVTLKSSIQSVLNSLKAMKMLDCIRIKEEVNKEKLSEYSDEVIASVGAVKKTEDVFWYEVDKEKLTRLA